MRKVHPNQTKFPRVVIHLGKIAHNYRAIHDRCLRAGIQLTGVVKGVAGDLHIAAILVESGLSQLGDSRLENLRKLKVFSRTPKMMLRLPSLSRSTATLKYAALSLNSEPEVLRRLNQLALPEQTPHQVLLMVDLGDLREGVSEEKLWELGACCRELKNIRVVGLGTNFSCFAGAIPTIPKLERLVGLASALKEEFKLPIQYVSGGNSSSLPLLYNQTLPGGVNHLRIGEGILLGRETLTGSQLPDLHHDALIVEAEVIQVQSKPARPDGTVGRDAFGRTPNLPDIPAGIRALLNIGHQDTPLTGLKPLDSACTVMGGSSDYLVMASKKPLQVGQIIQFLPDYWSVLGLMTSPYVSKVYEG